MRPIGVVASWSKSFYTYVLVYKEAERVVREESLVIIRDRARAKQYLGVMRWLTKIDPLLPATQRSGVVDNPRLAEMATNLPFENSYVRIVGEVRDGRLEPSADPPTPRSEVLLVESPEDVDLSLGEGLIVGEHKHSGIKVPLDPSYLPYHICVVGATGTGKSRLVKALVDEVLAKTGWKVIVFDHSGVDYVSYYSDKVVDSSQIMPDPPTLGELLADASMLEEQLDYIVSSIYAYIAYMHGLGSSAKPPKTLEGFGREAAVRGGVSREPGHCSLEAVEHLDLTDPERVMTGIKWSLDSLVKCVYEVGSSLKAREATLAKMSLLLRTYARGLVESLNEKKLTTGDVVDRALKEGLAVVDLSRADIRVKRFVVKSVIEGLWRLVDERGEKPRVLVVVDEAHNYACERCAPSLSAIERTAREGRKWEIGLVLASQRMIDFSTDVRNNINTFYFSRLQTPGDFKNLEGVLDLGGIGPDTLSTLSTREFFFAGLGNPLRFPILVKVREVKEPEVEKVGEPETAGGSGGS